MTAPTAAPPAETAAAALPAALRMGAVRLKVRDGARSLAFYRDVVGLAPLDPAPDGALRLGAGGRALVELEVAPAATPRPRGTTGLFHLAILVPDRMALAIVLRRLASSRIAVGASDHLVSEALYFDDPDGNGIEVYRDRPREDWRWQADSVAMATEPLDLRRLLAEAPTAAPLGEPMPAATVMGHVHLQVGDLALARRFYVEHLGFAITTESYPGALFVSAGGYHHHLGLNTWQSRRGGPAPEGSVGLVRYEVVLPEAEITPLRARLIAAGERVGDVEGGFTLADPWDTRAVFRAG